MRLITSSIMVGVIAASSMAPAFADQRGHRNDRDHRNDRGRDDRGRDHRDDRGRDHRSDRDHRNDQWRGRGWYDSRGSHHDWRRGDRFDYRGGYSNYVVFNDYNRYRLPPPRYGERYYRDNDTGDILLIAAATGLVLWALTN